MFYPLSVLIFLKQKPTILQQQNTWSGIQIVSLQPYHLFSLCSYKLQLDMVDNSKKAVTDEQLTVWISSNCCKYILYFLNV